jgi:Mrp family chromosome partitioning ATPase
MARTLQALRRDDQPSRLKLSAPPAAPEKAEVASEEEIPFIEVGGKNTPTEASASVLACAPRETPKLQLHRPEPVDPPAIEEAKKPEAKKPAGAELKTGPTPEMATTIITFKPLAGAAETLPPAKARLSPELLAFHQPDHAVTRQYEQVASAIGKQLSAGRSHVLLFTAASARTDSSNVVLNLSVVLGRQRSSRLVVVDAHPQQAQTSARLGLTGRPGLRDVLSGFCSLDRVLVDTGIASLTALAVGRDNPLPCLVAGDAMLAVLRHLKARFDCVMIDAPPWDGRPDVTALGTACDAIYVVLGKAEAESDATRNLLELIPQQGGCLRGCILT